MSLFDTEIDRTHSHSDKWSKYAGRDILPLWVADTDFQSPPCVIQALKAKVDHGVFGYGITPPSLVTLIIERMKQLYDWDIQPDWLVFLPGLVCGLNLSLRAFTQAHQRSITLNPIYPPFMRAAKLAHQTQLQIPVRLNQSRWVFDCNDIEPQLQGNETLLMLCNPLNPGGTVFRRAELEAQLAFAQKHDLIVCSDEIHCDLILDTHLKHIPFGSLNDEAAQRSVTLMAPSKTFNIAGLGASFAIIPNPTLRQQFIQTRMGIVPSVDILAYAAAEAAYRDGQDWLDEQIRYLQSNRDLLIARIAKMPGLKLHPIEATYLAWIDASDLPVDNPHQFFEDAGVGLSAGEDFGHPRFVRLNFGCTKRLLTLALDRMEQACQQLFRLA